MTLPVPGGTYRIKNVGFQEYLYATPVAIPTNNEKRIPLTWQAKTSDFLKWNGEGDWPFPYFWIVENTDQPDVFRIRNKMYQEYFYAGENIHSPDPEKREIFVSEARVFHFDDLDGEGNWQLHPWDTGFRITNRRYGELLYVARNGVGRQEGDGRTVWTWRQTVDHLETDWNDNVEVWQFEAVTELPAP